MYFSMLRHSEKCSSQRQLSSSPLLSPVNGEEKIGAAHFMHDTDTRIQNSYFFKNVILNNNKNK